MVAALEQEPEVPAPAPAPGESLQPSVLAGLHVYLWGVFTGAASWLSSHLPPDTEPSKGDLQGKLRTAGARLLGR